MDIEKILANTIDVKASIRVQYHGGSNAGASREIVPLSMQDGKVKARCLTTNAVKSFLLNKITILDGSSEAPPAYQAPASENIEITNLDTAHLQHQDNWREMGWHINHTDNEISLHRLRKNLVPLVSADVSITFTEFTSDLVMGPEGELKEENKRKRARPWTVSAKGKEKKSFGNLQKAFELFLASSAELRPNA